MFLKNVWYAAGHSETLESTPISRRICDEPIMFYRTGNGSISALHDRCPHRFVPLSAGTWTPKEDVVQCGYHGLRFDSSGQCVLTSAWFDIPPIAGTVLSRSGTLRSDVDLDG